MRKTGMIALRRFSSLPFVVWLCWASFAVSAQPAETEIPGVSAEMIELRQTDGVLRLAVRLANGAENDASGGFIKFSDVVLVEAKSKKKYFPLRGADGNYIGGPISDWGSGGRWLVSVPGHGEVIFWALFEPLPPGSKVSVRIPSMFPFDDTLVTEGARPPSSTAETASETSGLKVTVISAKRAEQQLKVRLKMVAVHKGAKNTPMFHYRDVFFFDPETKRKYPLLKDEEGNFEAQPIADRGKGGRYNPGILQAGSSSLVSLTFMAPPDAVATGDLLIPGFLPLERVAISGEGGAVAGGTATGGKSLGLEGALKELAAEVTPEKIKISLSADVLFDFDKADLKPAAEAQLQNLLTVVRANPSAAVLVEGHADGRGASDHNLALSKRRAESVQAWLVAHGASAANITTKGWGSARPVAPNTKPDGTDDPDGRQKNRRVEIVVKKAVPGGPAR